LAEPIRCTRSTNSKSAISILAKVLSRSTPALLTRMSTRPHVFSARAAIAETWSKSATSAASAIAIPPAARISSTTLSAFSEGAPFRPISLTTTFAPRAASPRACERPRPEPAPVTMATLPSNWIVMTLPYTRILFLKPLLQPPSPMQRSRLVTQVSYLRVKDGSGGEMRDSCRRFAHEKRAMTGKTGSDVEDLRALLAEVKALREDVERKGAELRGAWGAGAGASKVTPRVLNLSHYIALRGHDLTDLQYRLAARGLSSLGRSESHVALALDTLITTLRRLTGEPGAPYPAPAMARAGASELEAEADRLFGKRQKGGPRARVMATLPTEAATEPAFVANLVTAGMDCARINC